MIYFVYHYFCREINWTKKLLNKSLNIHTRTADTIPRDLGGKKNATKHWNDLAQIQAPSFYTGRQIQKLQMKEDVLEFYVFPVLLLGTHTWSLTEKEEKMLQMCQRKMVRRILHVVLNYRERNAGRRKRTIVKDIVAAAGSLKWKWGSQVTRTGQRC